MPHTWQKREQRRQTQHDQRSGAFRHRRVRANRWATDRPSGRPVAQQDAEVRAVGGAVAAEVGRAGLVPRTEEDAEVRTVNHSVAVQISGDGGRPHNDCARHHRAMRRAEEGNRGAGIGCGDDPCEARGGRVERGTEEPARGATATAGHGVAAAGTNPLDGVSRVHGHR
jgi:hypothetical protein